MANKLLSKTYNGDTNYSVALNKANIYTVPENTTAIVLGFSLSNLTDDILTTSVHYIDDDAGQEVHVLKDVAMAAGSTLEIMNGNKMILNANDAISVSADTSNSFDAILSLVEQS